jgi:hypothetical protein
MGAWDLFPTWPSGTPSPEFGAGSPWHSPESASPFGPFGESNPLPSGMQSPELGVGPIPYAMTFPVITAVPTRKQASRIIVFLFIYISLNPKIVAFDL